jgi:hypothetical protein
VHVITAEARTLPNRIHSPQTCPAGFVCLVLPGATDTCAVLPDTDTCAVLPDTDTCAVLPDTDTCARCSLMPPIRVPS